MTHANALLAANNATSLIMVLACWWLAHQYARIRPPGRAIAAGFSLLGLSVLFTMVGRNLGFPVAWPVVVSKALLGGVLVLIALRRHLAERAGDPDACKVCGALQVEAKPQGGARDVS